MRAGHAGTGPGPITPDGCSVELYERMPVLDEPEVIAAAVPAGASILELGCGAGRVTRPLVELGFAVTAVDESADMLRSITYTRTVCASIETLDLGETFDVAMLGSYLVHAGDVAVRQALLETCRRHVTAGGGVLIQREGEGWHDDLPRESRIGAAIVRTVSSVPIGDGVRSVRSEYVFPDATWTQTFLSRPLTRDRFENALLAAGLAVQRYLVPDGVWVLARPVG